MCDIARLHQNLGKVVKFKFENSYLTRADARRDTRVSRMRGKCTPKRKGIRQTNPVLSWLSCTIAAQVAAKIITGTMPIFTRIMIHVELGAATRPESFRQLRRKRCRGRRPSGGRHPTDETPALPGRRARSQKKQKKNRNLRNAELDRTTAHQ